MSEKESLKRIRIMIEGGPTREYSGDRAFVIGRSQNVECSIPHPNLSREHVRVSLRDGEVWMEDLGSANGTFVQGQKIPSKSLVKIKPHYRVLLGTGSNVILTMEVVESTSPLLAEKIPKGDVDLPTESEPTKTSQRPAPAPGIIARTPEFEASQTDMKTRAKIELDFPKEHFPQEVKKEKVAELRIIEAKKQRVLEDIQYKEREVDDLRSKIRSLREESLKLKELTENYKKEVKPLEDRKLDLEEGVAKLDVIYEEKIDSLESGFQDLKQTLEESHSVRMARADKDYKDKVRRMDEDYARKLQELENETASVRKEGERLRDTLVKEKHDFEENLKKVRGEAAALEAERHLTQVRIDTEIAKLQGTKMRLENDLESLKRKQEKIITESNVTLEMVKREEAKLEEARKSLSDLKSTHDTFLSKSKKEQDELARNAQVERDQFKKSIEEIKQSESSNIRRIEELKLTVQGLELKAAGIDGTLKKADSDATQIRNVALQEAEGIKRAAENSAAEIRLGAQSQVEDFKRSVEAQIEEQRNAVRKNAETQAAALLQEAEAKGRALVEQLHHEANQFFESKRVAAEQLFNATQARAHELESGSKNSAERAVAEANAQLDQKRRSLETEMADLRRRTDQEIRQVRQNALNDIEAAKERESKDFASRLRGRVKEIGDQIDRIVGSKLAAQYGVNMDPVSMKAFSEEIHKIVETVIAPSKNSGSGIEKTMSSIMPQNQKAQDRAVLYWKKVGISAAVVFGVLLAKVVFPEAFTFVGTKIISAVDVKDNTDAVVKRMLRERQLAMTFVTTQDQQFRDTYTDNILYTEGFIEMKEDVETQKVWTLGLNKFFQSELGLTEKAIVQFGSAEGRMIRDLIDLRKQVVPQTSQVGLQRMRDMEAPIVKEMRFIVRTEANWHRFQAFHRDFYSKYTQTFINRAPASNNDAN